MSNARRGPPAVTETVDYGKASLLPDADRAGCWTLLLDGTPQSYVDLSDPEHLEFEYVRRLASVIDAAAPAGEPLRVLHLGGGGLTLPRYVAATRPGSVQHIVEHDAALIAMVRRVLPLPRGAGLRVRAQDARAAVESARSARHDLVISDVYGGARMPGRMTTTQFVAAVSRVLRPGGRYAVNLADGPPLAFTRSQVATLRTTFREVCLVAEPGVLRGRRFGNVVLVAGASLPTAVLATAAARDAFPGRVVHGTALDRFAAGAHPVTDAMAADSPAPPDGLFTR
ncbi:MAG TPA: fused MFS/spermidine synthase [Micromonosporaceae bacterium]|jgi:spermidine synthase|nr:fused MFS/spermidine synthase [Micromonosporaceae bacterium]